MAQNDYHLKIDGIEGESEDGTLSNQIRIDDWSWGERQTGTSAYDSGAGAGRVHMQPFHFSMKVNRASPKLMLACAEGKPIGKAVLTCRKAGGGQQEFLKYTFSDVLVSSYETGGSSSSTDPMPIDRISFDFAKIEVEYKKQSKDGSTGSPVTAGYDLKKGQKV